MILSSSNKLGFLSDPKYLKYKGFEIVDDAPPYFELLALPFDADTGSRPFARTSNRQSMRRAHHRH